MQGLHRQQRKGHGFLVVFVNAKGRGDGGERLHRSASCARQGRASVCGCAPSRDQDFADGVGAQAVGDGLSGKGHGCGEKVGWRDPGWRACKRAAKARP